MYRNREEYCRWLKLAGDRFKIALFGTCHSYTLGNATRDYLGSGHWHSIVAGDTLESIDLKQSYVKLGSDDACYRRRASIGHIWGCSIDFQKKSHETFKERNK